VAPPPQPTRPSRGAGRQVGTGITIGLAANVVVYLAAWWVSKRTQEDLGEYHGPTGIQEFVVTVGWGTAAIVVVNLLTAALLSLTSKNRFFAQALAISTVAGICIMPGVVVLCFPVFSVVSPLW
jgi:hypothetical protein